MIDGLLLTLPVSELSRSLKLILEVLRQVQWSGAVVAKNHLDHDIQDVNDDFIKIIFMLLF